MEVLEISGQFYVVLYEDDSKTRFRIVDGPYSERSWAVSMSRVREID
jgi:hypothetical protein